MRVLREPKLDSDRAAGAAKEFFAFARARKVERSTSLPEILTTFLLHAGPTSVTRALENKSLATEPSGSQAQGV